MFLGTFIHLLLLNRFCKICCAVNIIAENILTAIKLPLILERNLLSSSVQVVICHFYEETCEGLEHFDLHCDFIGYLHGTTTDWLVPLFLQAKCTEFFSSKEIYSITGHDGFHTACHQNMRSRKGEKMIQFCNTKLNSCSVLAALVQHVHLPSFTPSHRATGEAQHEENSRETQ